MKVFTFTLLSIKTALKESPRLKTAVRPHHQKTSGVVIIAPLVKYIKKIQTKPEKAKTKKNLD